ncbi:hypothetical protein BDA96_07G135000 [Sorghum bicolor]|uniref:Uncharacterized protein n=2 Tax=Sorghum bicolor TaxID=4558 RepID=A0A1B6PHT2_SORBI|nr:hypothetical protein BDA96_07G135000 [Sorghum bicolor]KAG0523582.1 hypothetical protein BDA96_07G135000 [Sorghum bicolor]KXG25134.1 hypothetical protein SORBI_3007G126000 [Sorghum bicolor]KXG25135.1 hypothetical protein SORBI_3007G126000 [Sorghum bicolor]KXG25136.1 hypothetical protein SORBI_3007G126000 [Sorghum bicolor]
MLNCLVVIFHPLVHDENVHWGRRFYKRRLVRLSLNCGNMIKVLMVAIFVSDKRFSCPSKS